MSHPHKAEGNNAPKQSGEELKVKMMLRTHNVHLSARKATISQL